MEGAVFCYSLETPYVVMEERWVVLLVHCKHTKFVLIESNYTENIGLKLRTEYPNFTFSPMILHHECITCSFPDCHFTSTPLHNSSSQPELSTSYPARIVGENHIINSTYTIYQRNVEISSYQRPSAFSFTNNTGIEFVFGPILSFISAKLTVKDDNLDLNRRQRAGRDYCLASCIN